MSSPSLTARPRLFAVLLLAVSLTAACGSDLGRQNFPRMTVTTSAVPTDGPINDPALTLEVQRAVDPCALMDATSLAALGTPDEGARYSTDPGRCHEQLTDAGGKQLTLDLILGDPLISGNPKGTIEGLPLHVNEIEDSSCLIGADTSRDPKVSISVQVRYRGGDACGAGQTALRIVVQRLHNNPARFAQPKGTLLPLDFCTLIDDGTITSTLGKGSEGAAFGLHGCRWDGGAASASFEYRETYLPTAENDGQQMDLGNGITGYQQPEANGTRCTIKWPHRPTKDDRGEVVSFRYENYHDDAASDACDKALTAVKAALPKLPSP